MASLYADEHIPLAVIRALQRDGHDVVRARECFPAGTADEVHFDRAIADDRVVMTQDADFLALSARVLAGGRRHAGVIYWPQAAYSIGQVIRRLKQYLESSSEESRRNSVKFL
jgi:hypothetical protein